MAISMTCILIEKYNDNAITHIMVNKYCDAEIPDGFTLMEVCGTDYEAYIRITLLFIFLGSGVIFVTGIGGGNMGKFN